MTDLTTRELVKSYLGGESSADDAILDVLITAASGFLEHYCGRVLVAGAQASYAFDYQCAETLFLSPYEFATVTAVANGDGQALVLGTDVRTMPKARGASDPITWIETLSGSGRAFSIGSNGQHEDAITVTGQIGMLTAPDAFLQHCATKVAAHAYRTRDTGAEKAFNPEIGQVLYRHALNSHEWDILATYRKLLVA